MGGVGAYTKKKENDAITEAAANSYAATSAALTVKQGVNWQRAAETTRQVESEERMAIVEAKPDIEKTISQAAISRGEGITSGISAARTVSNVLLQSSKAVEGAKRATTSKITDMWSATEDANYALQEQKKAAYNQMKATFVTGELSGLSALSQGIGGATSTVGTAAVFI